MKLACASKEKGLCRFILKTGSVFFLLFFTLIAPLAPLAAQVGSALFLLLVVALSPFIGKHQAPATPPSPPVHSAEIQTAELDSAVSEFVFYNEIPDAALRANQRQQLDSQADICDVKVKLPRLCDSSGSFAANRFDLNYPAEYLAGSQPPRAGPYHF